jgi:hypothetical protein
MAGRLAQKNPSLVLSELAEDLRRSENEPGISATDRVRFTRWHEHAAALEAFISQKSDEKSQALDTSDLPPELLKELSAGHADKLEGQIVEMMRAHGGSADLDQLLIGLYRKSKIVQKRRFLQNKLWRMVRKGLLRKNREDRGTFFLVASAKQRDRPQKKREKAEAVKRGAGARKAARRK